MRWFVASKLCGLLILMPLTFSQADTLTGGAIPGGAGWVGAGLLGLVLSWLLLVHLPAKDKQITEMVKARDEALTKKDEQISSHIKTRDELADRLEGKYETSLKAVVASHKDVMGTTLQVHQESLKDQKTHHEVMMRLVIDHCDKENVQITKTMTQALSEISEAVLDLRRAIEERREQEKNSMPRAGT